MAGAAVNAGRVGCAAGKEEKRQSGRCPKLPPGNIPRPPAMGRWRSGCSCRCCLGRLPPGAAVPGEAGPGKGQTPGNARVVAFPGAVL